MSFFTLHYADQSDRYPMSRTTGGKIAIPLFKTRESAKRFSEGVPHTAEWEIRETASGEVLAIWLRDALTNNAVAEIAIEPNPDSMSGSDSTSVIPIAAYLIELEMRRDQ